VHGWPRLKRIGSIKWCAVVASAGTRKAIKVSSSRKMLESPEGFSALKFDGHVSYEEQQERVVYR